MKDFSKGVLCAVLIIFIVAPILFFTVTPVGRAAWNSWFFSVQKADDATRYSTRKQIEDTCRAMMASYKSDCATYELYANSDSDEKQSWAEQARMRANKTAASYNEYVLKNSFVWDGNIPSDIDYQLPYLTD